MAPPSVDNGSRVEHVKPAPFDYIRPTSIDAALTALAEHPDAVVLAGGQSLLGMLNMRLLAPSHVIDIGRLPGLDEISVQDGRLRMGALLRHSDIATSEVIAEAAPILGQAVGHIGHPAIRNRGTLGGSLALADPAAELPACLLALSGNVEIESASGTRRVTAEEFFIGPFETVLGPGELLRAVEVPAQAPGYRSGFDELARRHGDYALAGLAIHGRLDGGCVFDLRLAFFAVSDRPVLAKSVAGNLEGLALTEANIDAALDGLGDDVQPVGQPGCGAETKLRYCRVLAKRVLSRMKV